MSLFELIMKVGLYDLLVCGIIDVFELDLCYMCSVCFRVAGNDGVVIDYWGLFGFDFELYLNCVIFG